MTQDRSWEGRNQSCSTCGIDLRGERFREGLDWYCRVHRPRQVANSNPYIPFRPEPAPKAEPVLCAPKDMPAPKVKATRVSDSPTPPIAPKPPKATFGVRVIALLLTRGPMQSKDIREALQLGKEKRIDHGVKRLVDAGKVLNVRGLYYLPGQSLPESHAAPPMAQQIRDFLKTGPKTTREILKAIPGNKATILTTLSRVCQRGERKGRVQTWLLPD